MYKTTAFTYRVVRKKPVPVFILCNNFGKCAAILIFVFTLPEQEMYDT